MTSLGNITFAGWVIFFHYFLSDVSNECSTLVCYHVCVCQSRESRVYVVCKTAVSTYNLYNLGIGMTVKYNLHHIT